MKNILFITLVLIFDSFGVLQALPSQVSIIRYVEIANQGNSLSTKGKERAAALSPYFMEEKNLTIYGPPVAIYAMSAPKGEITKYATESVTPLAEKLKLTVIDTYEKDNYKKMVEEISKNNVYHGKHVLICWDSSLIPDITRAFKVLQSPSKWPKDTYDRVWVLSLSGTDKFSLKNIPQRLLFGDTTK